MAALYILGIGDEEQQRSLLGIPGAQVLDISPPTQAGQGDLPVEQRDALAGLYNNVTDYIKRERERSSDMGLWNDETGLPTGKGLLSVGQQYAQALLAGTISPRMHGGRALEFKLDPTAPGFADRISTRTPSEVQVPDVHSNANYQVGAESFNASQGGAKVPYQQRTADIIAQQPGFERFKGGNYLDPSEVHEAYTAHLESNLRRMYDEVNATPWGKHAANWYPGANKVTTDTATQYDILPRQAAAMAARLSPGTPWDMNMAQFNRTVDIVSKHSDTPMTEAMHRLYREKYGVEFLSDGKPNPEYKPKWGTNFDTISRPGSTLNDHAGPDAGLFVRLFDEAHNPNYHEYRLVNPDGTYGAVMPDKYIPNSNGNIGQAISIYRNGSLDNISRELGDGHKIRSFYNNIVSPHGGSDVTIDTHAMAAANLMPWGASRPEVAYGFGNSPQGPAFKNWLTGAKGGAATGSDGLYPLYAEAYRRVAHDVGIHPRELQSMTWEGIKGLYEPAARRGARGDAILNENSDLWRAYENGTRTHADVQSAILGRGIKEPEWWARRSTPGEQWKPVDYRLP
jgi:hypothetical protein